MRVAISGATSYTGMCIAEAFASSGWDVIALARARAEEYRGVRRLRLERLERSGARLVFGLRAEEGALAQWIEQQALDVWIHHHHPMDRFRAEDYDLTNARLVAEAPLPRLAAALRTAGVGGVVYSGTYFEPGEGGRALSERVTPYAALKGEVSKELEELCREHGIGFAKVVVSAPTGALENEDRLTPQLILAAVRGEEFSIRAPDSVFDCISGEALASVYLRAALASLEDSSEGLVLRPSGWVVTAAQWADWVESKILRRLHLELTWRAVPAVDALPPVRFVNSSKDAVAIDWEEVAEKYAVEWRASYPFR